MNSSCWAYSLEMKGIWSGESFLASWSAWSQCNRSRRISSAATGDDERRYRSCKEKQLIFSFSSISLFKLLHILIHPTPCYCAFHYHNSLLSPPPSKLPFSCYNTPERHCHALKTWVRQWIWITWAVQCMAADWCYVINHPCSAIGRRCSHSQIYSGQTSPLT